MSTIYDSRIASHGFSRHGFDGLLTFQMKFVAPSGRKLLSEPLRFGQCANGAFSTAPARLLLTLMENLGVTRFSEIIDQKVDLSLNDRGDVIAICPSKARTGAIDFAEQLRLSRSDAVQLERLAPMAGINAPRMRTPLYAGVEDVDFYLDPMFQFSLSARLEDDTIVHSVPFDLSSRHTRGRHLNHSPGTAVARLLDHFLAVSGNNDWGDFRIGREITMMRIALEDGMIRYIGHATEPYWCDLTLQESYWRGESDILLPQAA